MMGNKASIFTPIAVVSLADLVPRAEVVSLGMVAMADRWQEMTPGQWQLASFVTEHLRLLETHRSLFCFKQKFHPCWGSRYIVASTALALPKIALGVLRVHESP